ncbi:hypothetical protein Tco_0450422 [Tanacetum coccineum]
MMMESKPSSDDWKEVDEDPDINEVNVVGGKTSIELAFDLDMLALEDYSIFDFRRDEKIDGWRFGQSTTQTKKMSKNYEGNLGLSMIGSLMYLTSSRPDIMFAVYAMCTRYQVNPKVSHLHAVKRIFSFKQIPRSNHTSTIIESSTQPQKTQKPRKPKRKDTQVPQPSGPTDIVADEAVHKELGDRTVESSRDEQSLGKHASKQGRMINAIDVDEDITLVNVQDDADNEMFDVITLNVSTAATTVIINTEEITLAKALEALKTSKPKVKGIVLQEPGESTTTTTISSQGLSQDKWKGILVEPEKPLKKKDYNLNLD